MGHASKRRGTAGFPFGLVLDIARRAGRNVRPLPGTSGESVIQCPHPGAHKTGDSHPSCRLNPDKNTFYCDPCGRGGGVVELARELGVELADLVPAESCAKASSRGKQRSTEKLPLRFVPSGSIGPSSIEVFTSQLGKRYAPEAWAAFGVQEGRVHPEGRPDRAEPAVAFPMPDGGYHVYRHTRPDKKRRWCFSDGGKAGLLTVGFERPDPVLLCEGEWDAMTAYEIGFAVATTTGAGAFRAEWAPKFGGRVVGIVYDVDAAGRNGGFEAEKALKHGKIEVANAHLPLSGDLERDGKDLTDYVAAYGADAFREFVSQSVSERVKRSRTRVCVPVEGAAELLTHVEKAFPGLTKAVHAGLATHAYLALEGFDRPLAVFLMGPPSSGKSLVIRLFFPHTDHEAMRNVVYRCDDFTRASFVSRAANVSPEKLAEVDLLPKLEDRVLLTKELAPIFRGKEDDLTQIFAVLTSVLDGDGYVAAGGSVGTRGYDRPIFFCWLGGTTPFPNSTWKVMSALGPRILFFTTDATEPSLDDLISVQRHAPSAVEVELQAGVNAFLCRFFEANPPRSVPETAIDCDDAACRFIAIAARFTARLRAGLAIREPQERGHGEARYAPPEKEHEFRLVRTLNRLAKASALILGRTSVDRADLGLIRHIALSSGPETRRKVAAALLALTKAAAPDGSQDAPEIRVRDIAAWADCAVPTARHYAEELGVLQIAEYHPAPVGSIEGGHLVLHSEFHELL
jgi:hypothetical protein